MKTIEEKAEEYISGYGDGYAPKGIDISQDPYSEERGFTLQDGKQIFIDGAKWALKNQWINVSEELPHEHHIWKYDENTTIAVLCMDENDGIWLDRMTKDKYGNWFWLAHRKSPIKWMLIPNSNI